jgi:hypothetical protein
MRMTDVLVTNEPRVYEEHSPNSFYLDQARAAMPGQMGHRDAVERLFRYSQELEWEIAVRSKEGQRAERSIRRGMGENRAGMSSIVSTSGGSFVTPQWLTELYAPFRSADRAFINQCRMLPIPAVGMQFNIPSFASTAAAGAQTDNDGVSDTDPTGLDLTVTLTNQAGEVSISQQLFDQGGDTGATIDAIVQAQINSQLNAAIDAYAITAAIAAGSAVTDAAAITIPLWFADLSAAREKLTDTAGTRLAGTHLFTTSDLAGYFTKQVDNQNRPIFLPDADALMAANDNPKYDGFLGLALPGGLLWYADDNIPASGANTQLIVVRPSEILAFESDPFVFAYPETQAEHLSVVVGLRKYVAVLPRYAKATATIGGASYPLTLV